MRFIFTENAEIDQVKDRLDSVLRNYIVANNHRDKEYRNGMRYPNCENTFQSLETDESRRVNRITSSALSQAPYNWTVSRNSFNWRNAATTLFCMPNR